MTKKTIYTATLSMGFTLTIDEEYQPTVMDGEEEYTLYKVPGAVGGFVGQVRAEVEAALELLCPAFSSADAQGIIGYIRQRYGDELEFLWEATPHNAIARRKDNRKWYLALLTLDPSKLGLSGDQPLEVINLRVDRSGLGAWALPGYHMNKKYWTSVVLGRGVPLETLFRLIDESYEAVKGK